MINKSHKKNYETLQKAMRAGQTCILEAQNNETKKIENLLCAFNRKADGEIEMIPFARMIDGNPFEMFNPPNPDGGFFTQEQTQNT